MTKMKKLFAVVLALAMLFTMAGFSASAENTQPTVTVTANKTVVQAGDTVEVKITLANLGGVQGTLEYDKRNFTYKKADFTGTINSTINNLKNDNGTLSLIIVDGTATLTFEATGATKDTVFAFNVAAASNETGTRKYGTDDVTCNDANVKVTAYGIKMLGSTIRATEDIEKQDLGFIGKLKTSDDAKLVEFGMIAAFTKSLTDEAVADADFTLDTKDQLNADGQTIVAHKAIDDARVIQSVVESGGLFTSHIIGTASLELMGKNMTARFYAKFEVDGGEVKTVYSENIYTNKKGVETATTGVSKRSIVKVLGSLIGDICNSEDAPANVKTDGATVISTYNGNKNNDNKQALLDFVSTYKEYLPESELIG